MGKYGPHNGAKWTGADPDFSLIFFPQMILILLSRGFVNIRIGRHSI